MRERFTGDQLEIQANPDLRYVRDLYIQLFETAAPFYSLGYNPSQIERARISLKQLENEKAVANQALRIVSFKSEDERYAAYLMPSRLGGWRLEIADNKLTLGMKEASSAEEATLALFNVDLKLQFFEQEGNGVLGIFYIFPETAGYSDINLLIKHLYDTEYYLMLQDDPISRIKAKFSGANATYKAAWVDEETKRDLVVHISHKYMKLGVYKETEGKLDVWRRLPEQELDGVRWIPFGRKINTSTQQSMAVFESQKGIATGKLAFNPQRI